MSYFISKFSFRINSLFGILALSWFGFVFVLFCCFVLFLDLPELRQLLFLYHWNSTRALLWFPVPFKRHQISVAIYFSKGIKAHRLYTNLFPLILKTRWNVQAGAFRKPLCETGRLCAVFLSTALNANIIIYRETVHILRSVAFSCFEMILCSR